MPRRPPTSTLFPYTTLFRSRSRSVAAITRTSTVRALAEPTARISPFASARNSFGWSRSEEHTSELQSRFDLVCRLLLEKKKILVPSLTPDEPDHSVLPPPQL